LLIDRWLLHSPHVQYLPSHIIGGFIRRFPPGSGRGVYLVTQALHRPRQSILVLSRLLCVPSSPHHYEQLPAVRAIKVRRKNRCYLFSAPQALTHQSRASRGRATIFSFISITLKCSKRFFSTMDCTLQKMCFSGM
jgi:hypothetical protein